ncbi:hypothetical protein [Methanoculleus sp. 10]|uniref:hypothetical protein n=1 Tax=Methanoculleus sp. 10 TaxID=430615 RepID=UPI0025D184DC|nr:hypothetical protein [Methanoculleus sp. 10]
MVPRLRGGETLPVPYPMAIATTVHSMGEIPEEDRIRLIPGYPHALPPILAVGRGGARSAGGVGGQRSALWGWGEGQIWPVRLESLH